MKQIKTAEEFAAEKGIEIGILKPPALTYFCDGFKEGIAYVQQFKPERTAVEDGVPEEWKEVLVLVEDYNDPVYAYYVEGKWYVSVPLGVMIEGCLGSKKIGGIVTHYLEIQLPNRPY